MPPAGQRGGEAANAAVMILDGAARAAEGGAGKAARAPAAKKGRAAGRRKTRRMPPLRGFLLAKAVV